jgi:hypothetical protein
MGGRDPAVASPLKKLVCTEENRLIHEILMGRGIVVFAVVCTLLSRPVRLWANRDDEPRLGMRIAWWAAAFLVMVVKMFTTPINGDEVFYLANSWSYVRGANLDTMPLRGFLPYAFVALGGTPSRIILASHIGMLLIATVCAYLAVVIARRKGVSPVITMLIGPVLMLCFAMMPMVFLRQEYFAFLFFMVGLWALFAPPRSWSRQLSIFLAFLMFALVGSTSLRQCMLPIGVFACLLLYPDGISRRQAALSAILGGIVGLAPTLIVIGLHHSLQAIYYGNVVFPSRANWLHTPFEPVKASMPFVGLAIVGCLHLWTRHDGRSATRTLVVMCLTIAFSTVFRPVSVVFGPPEISAPVFGLAVAGCLWLWDRKDDRAGARTLVLIWAFLTVAAIWNPQKMFYTLGPWLAFSILVGAVFLSGLPNSQPAYSRTRWAVIVFALVGLPIVSGSIRMWARPGELADSRAQVGSVLRLLDWMDQTADGGPVICVTPYHPICASNAWGMWNQWCCSLLPYRELMAELSPGLENSLRSGKASLIVWKPSLRTGTDNAMQFWVDWGLVDQRRADDVAREIAKRYTAVHWDGPIQTPSDEAEFLVRRGMRIPPGVTVLDDSTILNWRKSEGNPQRVIAPGVK